LFTRSLELIPAGVANSLSKTAPIFVALFAYLTLRERITSARLLLVGIMVAADILIGAGELRAAGLTGTRLSGDLMAVGAGALRALAEVLGKASLWRFRPSTVALWRFGVGFVFTAVWALIAHDFGSLRGLDERGWLMLIVLGGVCTSLSMTLYYRGLRDIPAHVAVSLRLTSAIVTAVASYLVLQEGLNAWHIAGITVLVGGSYLIVVRTARHALGAQAEPAAAAPPPPRVSLTETLRGRVALMVAVLVAVTVLAGTLLSIQHNRAVLSEQVRLTMGETATIILQLRGVAQAPSPETYRQYLDRIIRHRISGRFYSLEIMYAVVLDAQGNLIAHAWRDDLMVRDTTGRPMQPGDSAGALRLLALADSGELARTEDIIPVSAELERGGQVMGLLKMGCKRSIAYRAATEIALRNLTLALLLVLLGIVVSYHLVGRLAQPLERLAAAARRLADGELDAPVVTGGGAELSSLGGSLERMVDEVRAGAVAGDMLAAELQADPQAPAVFPGQVALLAQMGGAAADDWPRQLRELCRSLARNEGRLAHVAAGAAIGAWGLDSCEQDDVLRAAVAGSEWLETVGARGARPALALVALSAPETARADLETTMRADLREAAALLPQAALVLTAEAAAAIADYLPTEPLGETGLFRLELEAEMEEDGAARDEAPES
jgi:drug/metabolite transporter (DMT)-like permease/HAMP domain-containing protein